MTAAEVVDAPTQVRELHQEMLVLAGAVLEIKDGIVHHAKQLLAEVAAMVEKQKNERAGKTTTPASKPVGGVLAWPGAGRQANPARLAAGRHHR